MGEIRRRKNAESGAVFPEPVNGLVGPNSDNDAKAAKAGTPLAAVRRWRIRVENAVHQRPRFWAGVVITAMSFLTHFWRLHLPPHVCWDETHFGKFANYYIRREFYFDVHPPLGKMLIGLAGALSGYGGEHEFKEPGQMYGDQHYLGMRMLCATMGALIVPCIYGIVNDLRFSAEACVMAALLIVFDTGMLTLTRFILLDAILMFFIIFSTYSYCHFYMLRNRPFTHRWWRWLAYTGAGLGCAIGTKWVGLFVVLFVGISTALELWNMVGDLKISVKTIVNHFLARVVCLIILPVSLYISFFYIHFWVLANSGPGDGFMSSAFQTTLKGNQLYQLENPLELAYGSVVTLKNYRVAGALLHSHKDLYPKEAGVQQQQVTTYSHKDTNNLWKVKHADRDMADDELVEYVHHGEMVRLEHVMTRRNLHSHNEPAPVTTKHRQVSGYGENGRGDDNDVWQVLIEGEGEPPAEGEEGAVVKLLTSQIRLRHRSQGCYLSNNGVQLPKWGFDQGEVTCNPHAQAKGLLWNVESIDDERLPKKSVADLAPSFWYNLRELHMAMLSVNNNMKPKSDEVVSRPWHWPVLYKGQHFTPWKDTDQRVFLLGNPVIWYGNLVCFGLFTTIFMVYALLRQRGYTWEFFAARQERFLRKGPWLLLGYLLHFLPFFVMGRVLYYHHYFPAHMFACMLSAIVLDEVFYWMWITAVYQGWAQSRRIMRWMCTTCCVVLAVSFVWFSPWTYGMVGPKSDYLYLKWRPMWEFA